MKSETRFPLHGYDRNSNKKSADGVIIEKTAFKR